LGLFCTIPWFTHGGRSIHHTEGISNGDDGAHGDAHTYEHQEACPALFSIGHTEIYGSVYTSISRYFHITLL